MMTMGLTMLSIVLSTFILSMHHNPAASPPPQWLVTFIFSCIAPAVCQGKTHSSEEKQVTAIVIENEHGKMDDKYPGNTPQKYMENGIQNNIENELQNQTSNNFIESDMSVACINDVKLLIRKVSEIIDRLESQKKEELSASNTRETWISMAAILDRFLFRLMITIVVINSIALVVVLPRNFR